MWCQRVREAEPTKEGSLRRERRLVIEASLARPAKVKSSRPP